MGLGAFFLGIAVLGLGLWVAKAFVHANPGKLAERLVLGGTVGALALGAVLVLAGRGAFGFPLIALGFTLWSRRAAWRRATPRPGGASRVRTQLLEMVLDLDTGAVSGRIVSGRHAGRPLKDLTEAELTALWDDCAGDPDSRALLETYLDRRFARWREHRQADAEPGGLGAAGQGPMGPDEAYEILGLQAGAGPEEIRRAYRALMKKLHPDQGGSSYLAARVNQAKDVLLHRHR